MMDDKELKNIKYSYFNKMIYSTISNDEIWFLEYLLESHYFNISSDDIDIAYMFYISIYLYSIIEIDEISKNSKISVKIKDFINKKMNENDKSFDPFQDNWNNILSYLYQAKDVNFFFNMIDFLLKLRKKDKILDPAYKSQERKMIDYSKIFNEKLIINCWLELLFCISDLNDLDKNKALKTLNRLDDNDKSTLKFILKENWLYDNNEGLKYKITNNSFISIFNLPNEINKESDIFSFDDSLINYGNNSKTKGDIELFAPQKDFIVDTFKEKFNGKGMLVDSLKADENLKFRSLCRIIDKHELKKETNKLLNLLSFYLNKRFQHKFEHECLENDKIKSLDINSINNPNEYFRSSIINDIEKYRNNEKFKAIEISKIWIYKNIIWKKEAVKVEIKCNKELVEVRELRDEEIEELIDSKYSLSNGLYRINDNSRISSKFLTREELFNIIKDNYLFINIACEYRITLDSKNIFTISI